MAKGIIQNEFNACLKKNKLVKFAAAKVLIDKARKFFSVAKKILLLKKDKRG